MAQQWKVTSKGSKGEQRVLLFSGSKEDAKFAAEAQNRDIAVQYEEQAFKVSKVEKA